MADTVDVPAVGPVDKKLLWGSVAVAAVFVGWMYFRSANTGSQEPVYDPDAVGVDEYSPAPSGNSTVDVPAPDDGINTDAEWTNAVVEALTSVGGWDSQVVALACGRYLARQTLTAAEVDIIRTARAMVGEAPSGPHPLNQGPTGTPPPGGGGGSTNPPGAPTGVRVLSPSRTQMTIGWDSVPGAAAYQVALTSRAQYYEWAGTGTARGYTIKGLSPGLNLTIVVRARNAAGQVGNWSKPLNTRTPK